MTTRRDMLAFLSAGLATLGPLSAMAQPTSKRRVGILFTDSDKTLIPSFIRGMNELGYIEGKNIEYLQRGTGGFTDRVPLLTRELVAERVEVIVVDVVSLARSVQQTVATVPVVMASGFDPVAAGVAKSLARPGYSVTGVVNLTDELAKKHLELIRELNPHAHRIGVLANAGPNHVRVLDELRSAATRTHAEIIISKAAAPDEVIQAIGRLAGARLHALIVLSSPVFNATRISVLEHTAKLRVPVLFPKTQYVESGGLMSYGPNRAELYRRAAYYVDKILKGAKPADLPIEQPTKFELVINMKTAKALGIKIPNSILVRANKVIE